MQLVKYTKNIYDINDFQEKLDITNSKYDLILTKINHLNNQYDNILETYQNIIDLLDSLNINTSVVDYINQLGYFNDFKIGLYDGINNINKKLNMKEYYYIGYETGLQIKEKIGKIFKVNFIINPKADDPDNLISQIINESLNYYLSSVNIKYIRINDNYTLSNNLLINDKKSYEILNEYKQNGNINHLNIFINKIGNTLNRVYIKNSNYVYFKGLNFIYNTINNSQIHILNTPIFIENSTVIFDECIFTSTPNNQNTNNIYWFYLSNNSNIYIKNCIFKDGNNIIAIYNENKNNSNIKVENNNILNINNFKITNYNDIVFRLGIKEW